MEDRKNHITLSELAGIIDDLVNEVFLTQTFWIVAETADVKNYADRGYCFVTLVEKEGNETRAKMEAVVWSRYYHKIADFEVATGVAFSKNIKLLLKVSVDFSPVFGLKLQIQDIDTSFTAGELERAKQAVLNKLVHENPDIIHIVDGEYVSRNKQLKRPLVFQRLALITAPDSDGRRDFLHELTHNSYGYSFFCDEYLCRIQGEGADRVIMQQLERIKGKAEKYDAVIIVRGGGSQLDFGPFDTYELGLTVASFPVPVITGIGHERNVSIADLMSHLQVKTPTKAASFLTDHNHDFEEEIMIMARHIANLGENILEVANNNLERLTERLAFSGHHYLSHQAHSLEKIEIALRHLDPENVIARGYAMLLKGDQIIVDPAGIDEGNTVGIRLKDHHFQAVIQHKEKAYEG